MKAKLVEGTVKHGRGKINIWGCMGWNGVGHAAEVEGTLTKEQYVSILEEKMLSSLKKVRLSRQTFYFQQDNNPSTP